LPSRVNQYPEFVFEELKEKRKVAISMLSTIVLPDDAQLQLIYKYLRLNSEYTVSRSNSKLSSLAAIIEYIVFSL
jgi:hypothetical protein